ncbi:MAG: STAS domain-containing protein [Burkholderiales bacterium]|jgi:SulP family sulfate permease|nr:STAS domain-containing protein [Burkholderiales bacterium]
MSLRLFRPVILNCIDGYNRDTFKADLSAGVTVGIVALPLAMAFAIASGVPPQAGIITAIITGFFVSLLGGSRFQIAGPTGAYIVIVYGIVSEYGFANLLVCTMASGCLLFLMGFMRLGALIRFIPVAIVIGFTNGIAVLIMLSQVKEFLGLSVTLPDEFFAKLQVIFENIGSINLHAVILSTICVLAIWFWPSRGIVTTGSVLKAQGEQLLPDKENEGGVIDTTLRATRFLVHQTLAHTARGWRLMARIPAPIGVLVLASLLVAVLKPMGFSVETIGTRFDGGIPQGFPPLQFPEFSWESLRRLASPTVTIALLGAIESLLSARVADAQTDDRHDPNQELMAQGIANIVVPFFGGIPATGAIARTATNIRAGAKTPIAGMIHSLALLLIILIAAPLASFIPLAALCAILVIVSINMGDWHAFYRMRQFPVNYRIILLATFIVTVIFDLTLAVEIGLVLASLFFIFRVANLTRIERLALEKLPPGVSAYRLSGSLFFGAVGKIEPLMDHRISTAHIVILDMHYVLDIDDTGLDALSSLQKALKKRDGYLVLCDVNETVRENMERTGFVREVLGEDHIVDDVAAAVAIVQS